MGLKNKGWNIALVVVLLTLVILIEKYSSPAEEGLQPGIVSTDSHTTNPPHNAENETTLCSLNQRYQHLRRMCNTQPWNQSFHIKYPLSLLVDDKYKLLFCQIPKTGTTTLKYFLGTMHDEEPVEDPGDILTRGRRLFVDVDEKERDYIVKNYFKFMIVRHPLERLPSCWLNRVERYDFAPVVQLLEKYRPIPEDKNVTVPDQRRISFEEYVTLLAEKYNDGFRNPHWDLYNLHCGICDIPYDHIFRLESLDRDIRVLFNHMRTINSSLELELTHKNVMNQTPTFEKMQKVKDWLNDVSISTVKRLVEIYKQDMEVFGYHWDFENGATCAISSSDSNEICC